jgi:hypothetical protein
MNATFTKHALEQMQLRGITEQMVVDTIANADKESMQDNEVRIYQKLLTFGVDSNFLLRVFVNIEKLPPQVITVYRTSKLDKYA